MSSSLQDAFDLHVTKALRDHCHIIDAICNLHCMWNYGIRINLMIVTLCPFHFEEMKLRKKSTARNSFSYATETLGLVFVVDVSKIKASFKLFYWLSVIDKSNISPCIFWFTVLCKMQMFFSCLMKAKLFFLKVAKLKMFVFILQSSFTIEKSERLEMCYGTKYSVLMRKYSNTHY